MENLPEPVLIDIFKYFNAYELGNLMKVCQRWSQIIRSSNHLSRHSAILLDTKTNGSSNLSTPIFNKIFNLHISGLPDDIILQEFMSVHGQTLEHVTFEKVKNINEIKLFPSEEIFGMKFIDKLKMFENVESLTFANGSVQNYDRDDNWEKIEWKNLKYLKLKEFLCPVQQIFGSAKLKKLKLVALKPSSLGFTNDFWVQQSQTLDELRILKCQIAFASILKVINAENLQILQLSLKIVTDNIADLMEALKNYKFDKITIKGLCKYSQSIQAVISNNPEVRKLKVINSSFDFKDEFIPHVNKSLQNLYYLKLPLNYGIIPSESRINFVNIKHLEFEAIKYPIHVNRLIYILQKSPNVKILRIGWIGNHAVSNDLFIKILKNAENIEEIQFGSKYDSFEMNEEIIEIIKENSNENLKKLTIFTNNVEEMRKKFRKLHDKNLKCVALDKNYEAIVTDEDRFGKFLMSDENKILGRFIGTCTWKR
ncbi:hypothetical protein PVAND_015452 [Polypedilum vanderplanki]|uniref:F-box domain-containing protein n=1 Tax=Polypedilum vanderplanki TaxID=319348 RepID=A0A9J6BD20_POLVA|nr:hypothetical protein PVAND_015452 [Polypedilum vanderplanki]